MTTETKPLEVELHVCPVCLHVGKWPNYQGRMKSSCTGPVGSPHKLAAMKPRRFREVVE